MAAISLCFAVKCSLTYTFVPFRYLARFKILFFTFLLVSLTTIFGVSFFPGSVWHIETSVSDNAIPILLSRKVVTCSSRESSSPYGAF